MYKVTYKTATRPTNLPEGAEVEEISNLPLTVRTPLDREITVTGTGSETYPARLDVKDTTGDGFIMAALRKEETRQIAHGLLEAIGEARSENDGQPAGRQLSGGEKVRLIAELSYGSTIKVGAIGTIESRVDVDDEYWVQFDGGLGDYVHYTKLVLV